MTIEVRVPQLPESVADAKIVAWHKKPGDAVARDENLVDLETDKVVLEVPAPVGASSRNRCRRRHHRDQRAAAGGDRRRRNRIARASAPAIMAASSGATTSAKEAATAAKLSPAAKRVVEENKLDAKALSGSGRDGRVSKSDVVNYMSSQARGTRSGQPGGGRETEGAHVARAERARSACRAARTDDPAAGADRRTHGSGTVHPGAADVLQRSRPDRRQRAAHPLQGPFREAAWREIGLHVVLCQGLRRGVEEISECECFRRRQ